jgi:hypothetical protein
MIPCAKTSIPVDKKIIPVDEGPIPIAHKTSEVLTSRLSLPEHRSDRSSSRACRTAKTSEVLTSRLALPVNRSDRWSSRACRKMKTSEVFFNLHLSTNLASPFHRLILDAA